jgi:hypothetical protein
MVNAEECTETGGMEGVWHPAGIRMAREAAGINGKSG